MLIFLEFNSVKEKYEQFYETIQKKEKELGKLFECQ